MSFARETAGNSRNLTWRKARLPFSQNSPFQQLITVILLCFLRRKTRKKRIFLKFSCEKNSFFSIFFLRNFLRYFLRYFFSCFLRCFFQKSVFYEIWFFLWKVLNSVPVFKEIIQYGDGNLANCFLSQSEFFKILKKLRITNNLVISRFLQFFAIFRFFRFFWIFAIFPFFSKKHDFSLILKEIALNLLEKFDVDKDNRISYKDFILFFCKDIRTLDFEEAFIPEIVFRLGIEIFRIIGKERTYLELRDLMNFLKENEALDIDFVKIKKNKEIFQWFFYATFCATFFHVFCDVFCKCFYATFFHVFCDVFCKCFYATFFIVFSSYFLHIFAIFPYFLHICLFLDPNPWNVRFLRWYLQWYS